MIDSFYVETTFVFLGGNYSNVANTSTLSRNNNGFIVRPILKQRRHESTTANGGPITLLLGALNGDVDGLLQGCAANHIRIKGEDRRRNVDRETS